MSKDKEQFIGSLATIAAAIAGAFVGALALPIDLRSWVIDILVFPLIVVLIHSWGWKRFSWFFIALVFTPFFIFLVFDSGVKGQMGHLGYWFLVIFLGIGALFSWVAFFKNWDI